jgi:DnaJ-class molecular chaperone
MSSNRTYYDILGVSDNADETEIKKAYRSLSLKHHPDRGGDAEKFKEMSEAFQTLSDPQKRRMYDLESRGGGMGGGMGAFFSRGEDPLQGLFQNLFSMNGGGGPGIRIFHTTGGGGMGDGMDGGGFMPDHGIPPNFANHPFFGNFIKPQAIHVTLPLDLEQVATGCVVQVSYDRYVIRDDRRIPEKRTVEVAVPQGVEDGEVITLSDLGNFVNGITGDVRVTVQVVPHELFRRDGLNLHYVHRITLLEALCGFQFNLPLLNKNNITIKNVNPPVKIVYPDMQQVCTGYGIRSNDTVGSLIIHFAIEFPTVLTEEQRRLLSSALG